MLPERVARVYRSRAAAPSRFDRAVSAGIDCLGASEWITGQRIHFLLRPDQRKHKGAVRRIFLVLALFHPRRGWLADGMSKTANDLRLRLRAHDTVNLTAISQQQKRRDTANVEARSRHGIVVYVQLLQNLDGELRNVTQSDVDRCANSLARAGKIAKVTSFQDGNDLACGLQIINPEDAEGL